MAITGMTTSGVTTGTYGIGSSAGTAVHTDSPDEARAHVAFRDYTAALVACAYGEEEFADDAQHVRHVEANAARINAWKVRRTNNAADAADDS